MKEKIEIIAYYVSVPIIFLLLIFSPVFREAFIIAIILSSIIIAIIRRRLCRLLTYNIFSKNIEQSIKINTMIKLNLKNNFKTDKLDERVYRELAMAEKELKKYFKGTNREWLKTTTNKSMYNQLMRISNKGIIKVDKISENDIVKPQPIPKLLLVGWLTAVINISNKEFWKYLYNDEYINGYRIYIIKN